jgi:hypothetical protein
MPIECRSTTYFIGDPDILSKTCKDELARAGHEEETSDDEVHCVIVGVGLDLTGGPQLVGVPEEFGRDGLLTVRGSSAFSSALKIAFFGGEVVRAVREVWGVCSKRCLNAAAIWPVAVRRDEPARVF